MRVDVKKWAARAALVTVMVAGATAMAAPSGPVRGEVRRIDAAANKVTLKHGPIRELELPAMTLVYVVQDPKLLDNLKAGDTVRFTADKVDGRYTVLSISK
jgi:Cu(I)/Ag(I) efflux system protein CusF